MKKLLAFLLGALLLSGLSACAEVGADAVQIALTGDGAQIGGAGAAFADGTLTITAGGVYELAGTLDGQVWIDADGADVTLILNGVKIASDLSSTLYVKDADAVTVTLADGSVNALSDAAAYTYDDAEEEEPDGAIFSKADLTIDGAGSLAITANHTYAIRSKDNLVIAGGAFELTSADTAVRANDSVTVSGGSLLISAGNDGIRASNDTDESRGWVLVSGGSIDITVACDGIQAETNLTVTGGEILIATSGEAADDADASAKGMKAGANIDISGGSISIEATDDGIHAGGDIAVSEGVVTIASGDDGVHADKAVAVSGGSVTIADSYEGIEGETILISGGSTRVKATDDGLNAGGGTDDATNAMGRGGSPSGEQYRLEISGGYVAIDAAGDGIDSNGDLVISGGVTLVSGPIADQEGAMDSGDGYGFTVTGGVLIAAGSAGMAETPGSASTQNSISVGATGAAGTLVSIADADGNVLYAFRPGKDYGNVLLSAPEIATGGDYTVTLGGEADGLNEDGYAQGGAVTGGEAVGSATIESNVTIIGDVNTFRGPGGLNRQPGGQMPGKGRMPEDGQMPGADRMPSETQEPADSTQT